MQTSRSCTARPIRPDIHRTGDDSVRPHSDLGIATAARTSTGTLATLDGEPLDVPARLDARTFDF